MASSPVLHGVQLAQVLPASLDGLCSCASDATLDINEDHTIGLDDQQAFERQEQARFRKTIKWLNAPVTAGKLMALTGHRVHPVLVADHGVVLRSCEAMWGQHKMHHQPGQPGYLCRVAKSSPVL